MQVTMTSILTGNENTIDVDVTSEQIQLWRGGMVIQQAMPHLSAEDREFLKTGITEEEWEAEFGDDE